MEFSALTNPESLRGLLRKLLRQESIDTGVLAGKWILTALMAAAVTATVVQAINTHLTVEGQRISFSKQVQDLAAAAGKAATAPSKPNYSTIAQKNIFGPLNVRNTDQQAKPASKLPLTLIGTFVEKGDTPYAIIEDDKRKVQDIFNIKDSLFGDATLEAIYTDRVEIKRNGQIEVLSLDDAPDTRGGSGGSGSGEDFTVDSRELDSALENLPLLLTQARAVPYFKDGKSVGLRLFSIKSGSLYEKVGLQNGDILKTINGSSLSDISQAMKLFETLRAERSISVTLERNREEKEFRYQIR